LFEKDVPHTVYREYLCFIHTKNRAYSEKKSPSGHLSKLDLILFAVFWFSLGATAVLL
jgi:hypothetical protein